MKKIAIYGAGGFGCEVACLINRINETVLNTEEKWDIIGFFDDNKPKGEYNRYGDILGDIQTLNNWTEKLAVAIAIGTPKHLKGVSSKICNPNIYFPNLISPDVCIMDNYNFNIGRGNIVQIQSILSCNVKIGDFNILNDGVAVGHDTQIGDFNVFMPAVKISGDVRIGNENLFGGGCFVKQQLKIGSRVVISPISALLTKPKDESLYIGNPAKMFKY